MDSQIQHLHDVWLANRAVETASTNRISFDDLTNSIISTGPFSYYIIDFYDMSLSHISPSLFEMHDFEPDTITFNGLLGAIHPEDIEFVIKAEAFLTRFFDEEVSRDKLLKYKISYCYRGRLKGGEYVLFNHQALMLTMDDNGGYGKSLNINTRIDHLSNLNTFKISLIGLHGEKSYMNMSLDQDVKSAPDFSKREVDILKLVSDGLSNDEIADKLFISNSTVKQHRKNILAKSGAKNTVQLIKDCILQGII